MGWASPLAPSAPEPRVLNERYCNGGVILPPGVIAVAKFGCPIRTCRRKASLLSVLYEYHDEREDAASKLASTQPEPFFE